MPSATTSTTTTVTTTSGRPKYPIGVPTKFSADGVVQRYPGNTTLCHIPPDSRLLSGLQAVYDTIRSHPTLSSRIHLLPPESWHMTIFDGVREAECEPGMWPEGMEKPELEACTRDFSVRLTRFGLNLKDEGLAPPYRMRVRGFDPCVVGIGLELEGATEQEEARMRQLRDRLADTLGFQAPNHQVYGFHISIAYLLRHIDGVDREELHRVLDGLAPALHGELELGAVEFCTFENMHSFPRILYLGEKESEWQGRRAGSS